jgi:hypothetical protein
MLIRVGYELVFNCPQDTPMILMVNIHYSRASDIVTPDLLTTDPATRVTAYRDGFGNWCSRIVAPAGRIRLQSMGMVRDWARPDVASPYARQHALEDLPEDTLICLRMRPGRALATLLRDGRGSRLSAISFTTISLLIIRTHAPLGPLGRLLTSGPESAGIMRTWPSHSADR